MARVECPITVIDTTTGVPIAGASVQIKYRSSGTNAPWYAAETGGSSSTSSLTTDANGRVDAWVDRGAYNCVISGSGITTYTESWDAIPASDNGADALWLPDNVIAARHLQDGVVGPNELAAAAVTAGKIAAAAVSGSNLDSNALNAALRLASGSGLKVAAGTSTSASWGAINTSASATFTHGLGATPIAAVVTGINNNNIFVVPRINALGSTTVTIEGFIVQSSVAFSVAGAFSVIAIG